MHSLDGHALPIDELKGTKPVDSIDLSGKGLGTASGFIIAACIKENAVLKELNLHNNFLNDAAKQSIRAASLRRAVGCPGRSRLQRRTRSHVELAL